MTSLKQFFIAIINLVVIYATPLEIETESCQLMEPIYNYTFDLTKLHSDISHTIKSSKGDLFEFNFCGNLTKTCDGKSNIAACLTRNNKQHVLGIQHTLNYKEGKMYFNFTGGEFCRNNKNFELRVILACDYTLDDKQMDITSYDDEQCTFYIKFETPFACLPETNKVISNTCSITNNAGYTFNLMPLSDENQWTSDKNGSFFVINVCKPVLYSQGAMCPPGSSICFKDKTQSVLSKQFINYGSATTKLEISKNGLTMKLESDVICNEKENYTSTVIFTCSELYFGKPVFFNRKGCNLNFLWETSLACEKLKFCAGVDPVHSYEYDLSSLSQKEYHVTAKDGKNYVFEICSGVKKSIYGANQIEQDKIINLGLYREHLNFSNTGLPYLLYESGSVCEENKHWSTKIEFVCRTNSENTATKNELIDFGGPKVIENSNCRLQIHFETEMACKNHISCTAQIFSEDPNNKVEEKYDLTSLMSSSQNYIALVNESKQKTKSLRYSLNVCQPLVPEANLGCTGGSAACMAVMDTGVPEKEKSLGYPEVSLAITGKNEAEIKYLNGDICEADKSKRFSSTIKFICDTKIGKGSPILESLEDNCHYRFVWPTNVICPEHLCKFDSERCEIINEDLNEKYRFINAKYAKNGIITIDQAKPFFIEICGQSRTVVTDYSQRTVNVFFSTNKTCENASSGNDVQLRLICSAFDHRSVSMMDDECIIVITQQTPDICKFLGLEIPNLTLVPTEKINDDITQIISTMTSLPLTKSSDVNLNINEIVTTLKPNTSTSNHSTSSTSGLLVTVLILVTILLGCGVLIVFRCEKVRERLQRIFRRDSSNGVQYSRVDTTEEASLLLGPNDLQDDSDDEMLV